MLVLMLRVFYAVLALAACLGLALAAGMVLARLGYLGTCQDGTCELVAVFYATPILTVVFAVLAIFTIVALKKRRAQKQ
ncbi:hypothetical protein [Mesorhizobium sp. A556]